MLHLCAMISLLQVFNAYLSSIHVLVHSIGTAEVFQLVDSGVSNTVYVDVACALTGSTVSDCLVIMNCVQTTVVGLECHQSVPPAGRM